MATLREAKTLTLTPTADAEALYSPQNIAADRAGQIAGATQFGRGWESAGLGEQANSLWTDSVKARLEGDTQNADVLALQAQDLQQQAAEWAPTVKNFTDVKGLRSGLDWAGGALGNLRTSVAPALGGLAGAAAGVALAPLTGGVINPATAGFAGAALAGYNSEMNEAVANAMNDPDIAAARTPEEIIRVGRLKGLGNSMLEALVPAMLGGKLVGQGAKRAVGAGAKGAAARIGQEAAIGGVGEFATETAQSLGGQTAQNYLGSRPLTDYDYQQAFNEGMSGLVGGGVMGGVGGTADVMYDRLGQGVDKAKEIKADPAQAAADMLAGAGKLGGTMAGKAAPVATKFVDWVTGSKNRTYDDLTNPSVPDEVVEPYAHEWATNVLATQKEHSADDVRAAAEYIRDIAKPGALSIYRLKIEANRNEGIHASMDASIADEIEKRVRGKTKSSKMSGTLVDDFGEQEGRDPSEDVLMDDFGNEAVRPAQGLNDASRQDYEKEGLAVTPPSEMRSPAQVRFPGDPGVEQRGLGQMGREAAALGRKVANARRSSVSVETTADIWRKQGVSEGLLSATTPITDEAQRRMAIAAMGWVERGFKDVDGNVFVPESLIKQQGKNVGTFIKSAVSTAFKNGLIGHDVASQASTIVEMAEKQHGEATAIFDTVKGAIPEYARKEYSRSDVLDQIIPMLRHVAKYGLSSDKAEAGRQEEALLKIFGTKEALAQAMSKFETPRGKNMLAQENDAEDVFDANELGKRAPGKTSDDEADARYESELATSAGETRYVGADKDNTPFDTRDPKQFDKLTALAGDVSSGRVSRVVGLWQRIKDSSQSEGDLREAESDLLLEHAKDFLQPSRLADIERYGVSMQEVVDTMPELQRRSILRKIDNRYKMIRLDNMGDAAAADAIPKGRTTEMIREAPKTIDQGGLFLEREAGGKVMKTPFATTAIRLIKHFLKSSEWDTISGSGLHGSYQAMLKSLAAVMETEVAHTEAVQAWYDDVRKDPDATPEVVEKAKAALDRAKAGGRFTGRIGYKTDLDGPVTWLPKGVGSRVPTKGDAAAQLATLPEVFKLGLKGSVDTGEGTLADAKKVATGALYSGDKGGALVPFETTFEGQVRALEELAARPTTSESFQWVINNTLERGPEQSERSWKKGIGSFYQKLRGWEDGEDNLFSAVSDRTAPRRGSLVDSERQALSPVGSVRLLKWLLEDGPRKADQTVVSTPEGKMPPARKVKIPDVIQEKIAAHTKAGRHSKALALREEWTKTFRDVAAWQIQNTEGRGSDSDTISVGDLTSDESALSMSRAEDPSMEDMTRPTTPFVPTYPVKWRKLLEMKDAEGVELTEDEVATLAELRKGPKAWRAKYGVPTRLRGTIERDDEGMALGLGDDAVGAGYGGGRSTNTGTESVVFRRKGDKIVDQRTGTQFDAASNEPAGAPLATAETPGRATTRIDPIEEARDWAFDKLRQGLAAFVSSTKSLSEKRREVLKLGVVSLAKMRPDAVVKYMDRALTEQQVSTILSRAAKAARMMGATLDEGGADGQTVRVVGSGRGTSGVAGAGTQASAGNAVLKGSKPSARGEDGGGEGSVPTGNGAAGAQGTGVTVSESASSGYRERTKHNADSADVTIAFAADYRTAGERLTATFAGSKYVRFEGSITDFVKAIVTRLRDVNGSTLNVAGNGIYTWTKHGKTQAQVNKAMHDVLRLVNKYAPLTKIVTGGQTGSDIAGAIAAKALGIPVEVTMPHGFLQRGADGTDFRQSREDVLKQIDDGAAQLQGTVDGVAAKPLLTERTVERRAQITRAMLKAEPDTLFLFGDNDDRRGLGGQAASMRGESNAVGVRTKAHPTTASDAFWSDSQLAENKRKIDEDLKRAFEHNGKVVIPSAGLGSGLARLDVTAPQTFAYLESRLKALEAKSEAKSETKPPEVVPMNFYDGINFGGVLHRMRPEFKGRTTLDLIKSGDRTATSRRTRPSAAVGDVLAMTNKAGERVLVRVTKAPYKVSEVTPEHWSKLEGWDTSVYAPYKDAWQYQYELVEKSEPAAPTTLTAKITKQLADAKTTVDKKNVIFDELTTLLDNHTERGAFGVRLTNLKDDVKDVASYLEAMSTVEMSLRDKLTPAQAKALTEMLTKAYRAFQMAHGKSVVDVLEGTKPSSQTANRGAGRELYTEEEIAKAKKFIADRLGDSVKLAFVPYFGDNSSGSWTPTNTKSVIRLALNGDIFGAAAHESMHEFFALLGKAGSKQAQDILLRTATNKILLRKVERLLDGNPEAVKQINADPEEALAFMYQFWSAGLLKLGPETRTFFQKVKDYVAKVLGRLSKEMQDEVFVDKVFRAFDAGVLSKDGPYTKPALTDGTKRTGPEVMDGSIRDAMLRAFEQNSEAHEQALDAIDKKWRNVTRNVGKLGFSAEAMMLATGNKQIADIMSRFNQETGTAMRTVGGKVSQPYFQGVTQHNGVFMNRLSNILTAYSPEDIELARKAMATGRVATDRVAKEITEKIYALNDDLFDYITSRKVMRLDDMAHNWVPVEKRKNYFPQVWNTDAVRDKPQDVIALLLKHNMKELTAIAANANAEVAAKRKMPIGTVSRARLADESTHTITETEIAEAIVARLLQAGGYVDHDETTSDLGISPVATSVNRRSLDFVRHPDFDEFKSHDMTSIMTSYVSSMVKRAEYTKHFGPGGETLRDKFDAAVLEEIGGDKLVRAALKEHGKMLADYLSRQQDAVAANERFRERRPSLRVIGLELHTKEVGKDKVEVAHQKAVKDLEQAAKAIMAMEGTLGSDISPAARQVVSAITAYQTVRLLPTVLFSSINDVMGIVARGGELGDAWKALVRGMREVRLRWKDEKSTDSAAMRAEEWGTVEAGSQMEVLGQIYGSMYMTGAARRLSNSFFKWNGMEGWNRAMRIEASVIAERALTALAKHGYNKDDPAAVARVEALYGKGFDTADIKLDENGRLDSSDEANQAAMMHWVQSAIMTPNASHRTIWGSDPRMAPFWHLKQFAYTFHRVMLKGAFEQAKLGNYRPAMVLALGYAPVTIAAGAVKEMLIPGDEPPWMKGGLDDYLSYGVSRAGIFGIPGMTYSSISDDYGVNMLGPTVSQVVNATTDAPVETGLRALPLGTLLGRAAPAQ